MKTLKRKYVLSIDEETAIKDFLQDKLSLKELGIKLGISHQGASYVVGIVCKEWMMDGKLQFNK